jgi:methylmalonyl-CoA mutase C-terminal domain/subunit
MIQRKRPIRVLIAKPGLDGHDRGAKVLTRALRDAGMEVIYTGLRQSPEQIVSAAVQEDVDIVGLSILSGAHLGLTRKVVDQLNNSGATEKKVLVGGTIPKADIPKLMDMGAAGVFPRTSSSEFLKKAKDQFCHPVCFPE